MTLLIEISFWVCVFGVLYPYVLYPLALVVLSSWRGRAVRREDGPVPRSVSVIVTVYNEEAMIGPRLENLAELIRASGVEGEILVVSDGSTDRTAEIARAFGPPVRVLELPVNQGKAVALNTGAAAARGEVLLFGDARQHWAPDVLLRFLDDFRDPVVGAVSGDLILESAPGVIAGGGLYWRYEKTIRRLESRLYSPVGVTGAISAVRRELFHPVPPGTILDDMYWPLCVAMSGHRVYHDEEAHAYDRLPERARDEFRRKVRTLSGNFQLVARLPAILLPWRNPVWLQIISHKLFRLVTPWALLGALVTAWALNGWFYRAAAWVQVAFYVLALLGAFEPIAKRSRLAATAAFFVVLHVAAWLAFWVWASGRTSKSWSKVTYEPSSSPN